MCFHSNPALTRRAKFIPPLGGWSDGFSSGFFRHDIFWPAFQAR
jgi:hypothetical protein